MPMIKEFDIYKLDTTIVCPNRISLHSIFIPIVNY